ncbi:MAG TPA: T9SS type A sorting domain-containing protein [Candidatus Marinimicrobia bacterium]|nr:T9SS type A sorting domain-containing protein [Candidatus Neomarinimicrobiota bacterium]
MRCYLTIQGTPSGHERLYIRATDDLSVFDLNNNGMDTSQVTDTLQLYDQLVPTVDSVSIPHGSPIGSAVESPINITFSEPIQSFGYSVSARHYSYLTYSTDTTATSFKVTLQPPMASLDTITLSIFNLTDNSGLEAVDFSYEFYTPPLGDYEPYDGKVNVLDLAQFVSFWMADSQPAILGLGPTSGTFPHLVPLLDEEYNLDDGMTFIRMWSWSLDRFGLEPLTSPTIGIAMNWDKLVVDIPMEAIAGQVYLRYNPLQGKVDLSHTAFGNNNLTLKREAVENGEILLEFGLVEPDDNARVISIKPEINEPAEATVIYKFFAADQSLIAAGTQKIALVIPTEFRLMQNYPNPFNNTTTIRYAVPEETFVQLEIFDIKGRLVETLTSQSHQPGFYALQWSGRRAASGVYFIKLEADKTVLTQKMILLK